MKSLAVGSGRATEVVMAMQMKIVVVSVGGPPSGRDQEHPIAATDEDREGHPRPRLRSPPPRPRQPEEGDEGTDVDSDRDDFDLNDPTTATNTASNANIHPTRALNKYIDIYSHSRRAPPRPRQPAQQSLWNFIPVPALRQRARAHSRSKKRVSRSAPPHTANEFGDPEYLAFDAAKDVRPPPRRVKSVPRASERAARVPTPPSILKETGPPRRCDFPLPGPTEAERNWRHTISRIPSTVVDAVLKERPSVNFDNKSRVHGYFESDPIYLTESTTPERRPSPKPKRNFSDHLPSRDSIPSSPPDPDNSGASPSEAIDQGGVQAFSNRKENPQLPQYRSLFDDFGGEELPPRQHEEGDKHPKIHPATVNQVHVARRTREKKIRRIGKMAETRANPRGIPEAPFIENVEDFVTSKQEIEPAIRKFSEMIAKYTYMMESNARRAAGLKDKIPDIKKTLQMVQFLDTKNKKGDEEPISTMFELSDTLYAKASVTPPSEVYLWLGANVMLAYPNEEAIAMLKQKLSAAQESLRNCEEDIDFLRQQITTLEVNTSRMYNWNISLQRKEKEKAGAK
ncbi:uncharacterized protein DFL_006285 [Arthrobotrys flagrans]|uniref:Prefoldin subunit 3 n=1 Tax=Arthrobotrys flagrans TaxID=97331 RepID=A0A437A0B3_ARTFL|nr:hypothetical protein DFL_006285 [Arthrobotrys flagrans]